MATQPITDGKIHRGQIWRTNLHGHGGELHTVRVYKVNYDVDMQTVALITWAYTGRPWTSYNDEYADFLDKWELYLDIDNRGLPAADAQPGDWKYRDIMTARTASFNFDPYGINAVLESGTKPSEILEEVRDQISALRTRLHTLGSVLPIWSGRLNHTEGGLTLCLIALHANVQEAIKIEGSPAPHER
jgi:hypothetical protein